MATVSELRNKGEGELVAWARKTFRESLAVGYGAILGEEGLSQFEAWFIKQALKEYSGKFGRKLYLGAGVSLLNYSAWSIALEIYVESMQKVSGAAEQWHNARAESTLARLEGKVEETREFLAEYPDKLVQIEEFNHRLDLAAENTVKRFVVGVGEGAGALLGIGVMIIGLAGGAVGYGAGRMAREIFGVVKRAADRLVDRAG